MSQNIWQLNRLLLHRQKRRSQIASKMLNRDKIKRLLDIGCSEGFATAYLAKSSLHTVGIELNLESLRIAKNQLKRTEFVNASIQYLPFRREAFDAVSILEVLEHLPQSILLKGKTEIDNVLRKDGIVVISVPYMEKIQNTRCIHCGRDTPLWGHINSFDNNTLTAVLPQGYILDQKYHLPNLEFISCQPFFERFPLSLWTLINDFLGLFSKGYWIVVKFVKE